MRPRLILVLAVLLVLSAAGVYFLRNQAADHQTSKSLLEIPSAMAAQKQPAAPAPDKPKTSPVRSATETSPAPKPAQAMAASAGNPDINQFARCLTKKQVVMYGAYWCSHCAEQKEKFGQAFKNVPYTECAIPGQPPAVQSQTCKDMQIKRYPTWVFPDGERIESIQTLEQLSQKTGCKLQ